MDGFDGRRSIDRVDTRLGLTEFDEASIRRTSVDKFAGRFTVRKYITWWFSTFHQPKEIWLANFYRLLSAVAMLLIVMYLMSLVQIFVDNNANLSEPALTDIGHEYFPTVYESLPYHLIGPFCFIAVLLMMIKPGFRWILFRRLIWCMAFIYFLRATTLFCTLFPLTDPIKKSCNVEKTYGTAAAIRAFKIITRMEATCSDFLFSGHTALSLAITLLIFNHYKKIWVKIGMILYCAAIIFSIIAAKFHYTVDVIVAIYLTILIYLMCYCTLNFAYIFWYEKLSKMNDDGEPDLLVRSHASLLSVVVQSDGGHEKTKVGLRSPGNSPDVATAMLPWKIASLKYAPMPIPIFILKLVVWMDGIDVRTREQDLLAEQYQ